MGRNLIKIDFALHDVEHGGQLLEIIDWGEPCQTCACGHVIRYEYRVVNDLNEETAYGSDCIAKLYLLQHYKTIDLDNFEELFNRYHRLFIKLGKKFWKAQKLSIQLPKILPRTLQELEETVKLYQDLIAKEIAKRKAEVKLLQALLHEKRLKRDQRKRRKLKLLRVPSIKLLRKLWETHQWDAFKVGDKDFKDLVSRALTWFYEDKDWELSEKQVWRLNDLVTRHDQREREERERRQHDGKWNVILDAIRGSDNAWCKKMDVFFKQNGFLSQRQVDVINRILGTNLQVPTGD